ncbi:alkaline phosphatase family protein [Solimonas soli]|uniref:alkaline phosphatase family protein n=1 Tax=Solimonas soli TaxID=413479 RepID=UPI00048064C3|nr:alkaline phosphatase family protein [Solimonas soli]
MFSRNALTLTPIAAACCMLAACGNDDNGTTYGGLVASSAYVAGSATGDPTLKAGHYQGATVCVDANGNGKCDSAEKSATTDSAGHFSLKTADSGDFIADITTSAINTADGAAVSRHLILRASADQVKDQGDAGIVISPASSEVQRLVEANGSSYATEKANLATRLSGPAFNQGTATLSGTDVLADVNTLSGAAQYALLYAYNELGNRYTYATTKFDRGDKYPDALAVAGGDPRLSGLSGITAGETVPADTRKAISFEQAQQAAFNIEGVPAYDNIFIIMLENKSTDAVLGNSRAPQVNGYLAQYNQLTTYYSTGNPSEPNYTALGGGDDWGITDDNWFGCGAAGANAPTDSAFAGGSASDGQPLPKQDALPPLDSKHLAGFSTTAGAPCSTSPTGGTNHNAPGDNLFTLLSKAGLTWRTYSESMNPGQDVRADSIADPAVVDTYDETDSDGTHLVGTSNYAVVNGLYKVKHGPSIAYQTARKLPEFVADNRTIFGTQYTEADWKKTSVYTVPDGWMYDQFGADLAAGDVGTVNFVVPDQCDDMHGVGSDTSCSNNNNGKTDGITRSDIYVGKVVSAIRSSALWKNPQKRVAIVIMFDEGEGSSTSCCGWNAGGKNSGDAPVTVDAIGTATATSQPSGYGNGNIGHGNSIFSVITNQQDVGTAAKGVKDSDAYSHFSLVRTLQDMFQIADPGVDASYLNRAKYTEAFIAQNLTALPEFAGSADTHFDSVRPINHAYVIPANYVQRLNPVDVNGSLGTDGTVVTPQTGPDANQNNVWALK